MVTTLENGLTDTEPLVLTPTATAEQLSEVAAADEKYGQSQIIIKRVERIDYLIPVVGMTPYIPNKWSEKALRMMREAQSGGTRTKKEREAKDGAADAHGSTYWIRETPGHELAGCPAVSFKAAMVGACRAFTGIAMTEAKTLYFVRGVGPEQLVPILALDSPDEGELIGAPFSMREDTPRNANRQPDLRYRNQFYPWRAVLQVEFPPERISLDSILALIDEAGRGGVGDWRPNSPKSHTGTFGQFRLDEDRQIIKLGNPFAGVS